MIHDVAINHFAVVEIDNVWARSLLVVECFCEFDSVQSHNTHSITHPLTVLIVRC